MNIGFIGTGIMGLPMAGHLLRAGYRLRVYNRTQAKARPLAELGAELVSTPADAAQGADILISIVSRTEDVREVLLGEHGAAKGAQAQSLFIDMSTIDAEQTKNIAAELADMGIGFVDAPVSGGEGGAQNASLSIFCGGSDANIERARPVLSLMGKKINHMGPSGAGQIAKACNQILVGGALLGVAEALGYAKERGLDLLQLVSATSGGAAQSWQLENLGPLMAQGDYSPGFMIDLLHKDLSMIATDTTAAMAAGDTHPVVQLVLEKLDQLRASGDGSLGTQAVYKTYIENKLDINN